MLPQICKSNMTNNSIFRSFCLLLLPFPDLLLQKCFLIFARYSPTGELVSNAFPIQANLLTFQSSRVRLDAIEQDWHLTLIPALAWWMRQLFNNCISVDPVECRSFGKIYTKDCSRDEWKVDEIDEQGTSCYPTSANCQPFSHSTAWPFGQLAAVAAKSLRWFECHSWPFLMRRTKL